MGEMIERSALFAGEGAAVETPRLLDWPRLGDVGLSSSDRSARMAGVGGSDANIILSGDPAKILALWQEKRAEQEPTDLTGSLAVMLGCWTEEFNRLWYEKLTGNKVPKTDGVVRGRWLGGEAEVVVVAGKESGGPVLQWITLPDAVKKPAAGPPKKPVPARRR